MAARDHHLLHFGRALIDAQRTNFAIEALHRLALDHTQPAEHLDGLADDAMRGPRGIEIGDGRFETFLASPHVMRPPPRVTEQRLLPHHGPPYVNAPLCAQ